MFESRQSWFLCESVDLDAACVIGRLPAQIPESAV